MPFRRALPLAFASDTASIGLMEIIDNAFLLLVPGAMQAGLGEGLFWWSLGVGLEIAFLFPLPLNRWLIACAGAATPSFTPTTRRTRITERWSHVLPSQN